VIGKPHARTGLSPPVVSSVVHSATKVALRLICLTFHLFEMLRPSRREVIPWPSRTSLRGGGLSASASSISRRFINSSCKMRLRIVAVLRNVSLRRPRDGSSARANA